VPLVYARDIAGLCKAAGIAQAVFVGTSMGGLITMALAALEPKLIAGAVLNDVGPQVAKAGLVRIASYAGKTARIDDWEDAAQYIRSINEAAFPDYGAEDWRRFARRTFRTGPDGKPQLDYDPDISAPIKAAGPKALTPNHGQDAQGRAPDGLRRDARRRPCADADRAGAEGGDPGVPGAGGLTAKAPTPACSRAAPGARPRRCRRTGRASRLSGTGCRRRPPWGRWAGPSACTGWRRTGSGTAPASA
jgi:pimeloyl-ACP methyl ester carboxylesterase